MVEKEEHIKHKQIEKGPDKNKCGNQWNRKQTIEKTNSAKLAFWKD